MMFPNNILLLATLASLTAALPKGGGGGGSGGGHGGGGFGSGGGRSIGSGRLSSSSKSISGAVLGGISGYALGSLSRSASQPLPNSSPDTSSPDGSSSGDGGQTYTQTYGGGGQTFDGAGSATGANLTGGTFQISNVTIHQSSGHGVDPNTQASLIVEDFTLTVADITNEVSSDVSQCNLTWMASTANPSGPPATGQMTCVNATTQSHNYNVTLQQQTESPLPGFYLFVAYGKQGEFTSTAAWMPKNISNDPSWQINENYFTYAGPVTISQMPNQSLAQYIGLQAPQSPNDQIQVANLANNATASAAAQSGRVKSASLDQVPQTPDDQIKVADLANNATASAAANAPAAAAQSGSTKPAPLDQDPQVPNDQIKVADLANSATASAAANAPATATQPAPSNSTSP